MGADEEKAAVDLAKLDEMLSRFRDVDGALLPILHAVQEEYGFVPPETIGPIAKFVRATPPQVYGIITFYSEFRTKPRARKVVGVCRGPACRLTGGKALERELERELGIIAGDSTPDGSVGMETVSCLGICGLAPAVELGHDLIGRAEAAQVKRMLAEPEQ